MLPPRAPGQRSQDLSRIGSNPLNSPPYPQRIILQKAAGTHTTTVLTPDGVGPLRGDLFSFLENHKALPSQGPTRTDLPKAFLFHRGCLLCGAMRPVALCRVIRPPQPIS